MLASGIKSWSEEDRPREKLLQLGKSSLSNAELLAILIGSGSHQESAVDLCRRILGDCEHNLNSLSRKSLLELTEYKGIGEAKAITIIAALELAKRSLAETHQEKTFIKSSHDAYQVLQRYIGNLNHEEAWVLFLKRSNEVIAARKIGQGGFHGTVMDPKVIFRLALQEKASAIILAHNHPSGNLKASKADIQITQKLKSAAQTLEISLLDHIIVGDRDYLSMADSGLL